VSTASITTLPPGAFDALLHATDPATCVPGCATVTACQPVDCSDSARGCDVFDCGLLLQQALREIDLLRSGLENAADLRATRDTAQQRCVSEPRLVRDRERQEQSRALYAVRPIGDIPLARTLSPSVEVQSAIVIRMVTNLGTLMDVLV
jgi:hypothetical protein